MLIKTLQFRKYFHKYCHVYYVFLLQLRKVSEVKGHHTSNLGSESDLLLSQFSMLPYFPRNTTHQTQNPEVIRFHYKERSPRINNFGQAMQPLNQGHNKFSKKNPNSKCAMFFKKTKQQFSVLNIHQDVFFKYRRPDFTSQRFRFIGSGTGLRVNTLKELHSTLLCSQE